MGKRYQPPNEWTQTEITLQGYNPPTEWTETEIRLRPVLVTGTITEVAVNTNIDDLNSTIRVDIADGKAKLTLKFDLDQQDKILNSAQYNELTDDKDLVGVITRLDKDVEIDTISKTVNPPNDNIDTLSFRINLDKGITNSAQEAQGAAQGVANSAQEAQDADKGLTNSVEEVN